MKVMCIDNTNHIPTAIPIPEFIPVTATQCPVYEDGYDIAEFPVDKLGYPISYNKRRFIPLSDIDETETEVYKNLQVQTV